MDREIAIPGPLRLLHGESATIFDLLLVYAVGIASGVLALVFAQSRVAVMEWWKALLLFVVALDVCGGAVACFTSSTARYYEERPSFAGSSSSSISSSPGSSSCSLTAVWATGYSSTSSPPQQHPS